MARPQFTTQERNFLAFEYHKRKGHRNFMPGLIMDFGRKFLNARQPALCHVRRIYKKAMELGTVLNVNSKTSPGNSFSGRSQHVRTPRNVARVAAVINRDAAKHIGAINTSPVSSARRNSLMLSKSSWISTDIEYRPYRPIKQQELKPEDLPRRIQFCTWIRTLTDYQLGKLVLNFELNGSVNSQKVRRYAPLKSSDPVNGGRGLLTLLWRNQPFQTNRWCFVV